uniref:Uncharacterized protein n=1 Tax=Trichogramma kaykai TaxID=54128 RepID=A0ABD2XMH0_9HYME
MERTRDDGDDVWSVFYARVSSIRTRRAAKGTFKRAYIPTRDSSRFLYRAERRRRICCCSIYASSSSSSSTRNTPVPPTRATNTSSGHRRGHASHTRQRRAPHAKMVFSLCCRLHRAVHYYGARLFSLKIFHAQRSSRSMKRLAPARSTNARSFVPRKSYERKGYINYELAPLPLAYAMESLFCMKTSYFPNNDYYSYYQRYGDVIIYICKSRCNSTCILEYGHNGRWKKSNSVRRNKLRRYIYRGSSSSSSISTGKKAHGKPLHRAVLRSASLYADCKERNSQSRTWSRNSEMCALRKSILVNKFSYLQCRKIENKIAIDTMKIGIYHLELIIETLRDVGKKGGNAKESQ